MDYVKAAATVVRLINANGRTTVLQRLSAEPADPGKPWKGAGEPSVEQSVTAKGVFVPPFNNESLGQDFIRDELLARADEVFMVGPNAVDLTTFTSVLDGGLRWNIEWCQVLKPADVLLLYAFGVRR